MSFTVHNCRSVTQHFCDLHLFIDMCSINIFLYLRTIIDEWISHTHTNIFPWKLTMTMRLLCNGRQTGVSGTLCANFVLLPSVRGAAYWIGGAVWSPDCPRCAGNELSEGWEGWRGPFQKYAFPLRPLFLVVYNVKRHSCQDAPCLGDFSPLRQLFR